MDGQTDRFAISILRASVLTRNKNTQKLKLDHQSLSTTSVHTCVLHNRAQISSDNLRLIFLQTSQISSHHRSDVAE